MTENQNENLTDIIVDIVNIVDKHSDVINELTDNVNKLIDDITTTKAMLKLVLALGPKER